VSGKTSLTKALPTEWIMRRYLSPGRCGNGRDDIRRSEAPAAIAAAPTIMVVTNCAWVKRTTFGRPAVPPENWKRNGRPGSSSLGAAAPSRSDALQSQAAGSMTVLSAAASDASVEISHRARNRATSSSRHASGTPGYSGSLTAPRCPRV